MTPEGTMARTTIAALLVAAGLTLGACTAAPEPSAARPSCAGPEVDVSATHATPGTTLTLTGSRFMDGCNDVLPTTTSVDPYSALAITVVAGDIRFDAGSVTPDAEGGWSLRWTAPDDAKGPVTVEASADGREVGLDVVGPSADLITGEPGVGDMDALLEGTLVRATSSGWTCWSVHSDEPGTRHLLVLPAGTREVDRDTGIGLELPDGRGRAGIGDRVALGGGRVSGGRADELLTPCGATDVWAAASIKVLGR